MEPYINRNLKKTVLALLVLVVIAMLVFRGYQKIMGDTAYRQGSLLLNVQKNTPEALKFLLEAGEYGDVRAQRQLGYLYSMGDGVPQNDREALKWYRLAADQGDQGSQSRLGQIYGFAPPKKRDLVAAYMWFTIATDNGINTQNSSFENRAGLAAEMTPDQIAAAEAQVVAWYRSRGWFHCGLVPEAPSKDKRVDQLIEQVQGKAYYWRTGWTPVGYWDSWSYRNFELSHRVQALELLGELGPAAKKALPVIISMLKSSPPSFNTGDGGFGIRAPAARALAKIGDPAAIPALMDMASVLENNGLTSGASGVRPQLDFSSRLEVIRALGTFGSLASPALPLLEKLQQNPSPAEPPGPYQDALRDAMQNIRTDNRQLPY